MFQFSLKKFFSTNFILFLLILFSNFLFFNLYAAESSKYSLDKHEWSFKGLTGTFDRSALQRGYKVYREVCSGCHSMNLLYYRDLVDIGFSSDQVKVIASEYTVVDGPDEEGTMFERPGKPSDKFVDPYANDQEARISNNGAYPPDLSVIIKAKKNGVDYLYNLLLGYSESPEGFEIGEGMYFNKFVANNQIAMPQPLYEGSVDYDDGTKNTLPQLSEDLVTFLAWASEPELEERKRLGIKVILFFIVIGILIFIAKRRLWKEI